MLRKAFSVKKSNVLPFLLFFTSINLYAGSLEEEFFDYTHRENFRNTGQMNQFFHDTGFLKKKKHKYIYLEVQAEGTKNLTDFQDGVDTKDEDKIADYLSENFGTNYDLQAKASLNYNIFNFSQQIGSNAFIWATPQNPIFPELKAFLNHDYFVNTQYSFHYKKIKWTPTLTLGKRKFIDKSITVSDILEKNTDFSYEDVPFQNFYEFSLLAEKDTKFGKFYINLQSIPLSGYFPIHYWENRIGYNSINLNKSKYSFLNTKFFFSIAPSYAGNHDMLRTIKTGLIFEPVSFIDYSFYFHDNFNPAHRINIKTRAMDIEFEYKEKTFDNFDTQKEKSIGINFSIGF